ncbi:MAG: thiamine-phosphate pyrophosphorylase [Candidatus Methanomethylophilaceae archaeon]|nr:thiamine-phosphate pyrophosphorylase [Candidatus Methanomethylophilaceae archaeon]
MKRSYFLYVITDENVSGGRDHVRIAAEAVRGGADVVQLRDKYSTGERMLQAAKEIREITKRAGTAFIVNDRLDVALLSGADGVHLGQEDIPLQDARDLCPEDFLIGISVGSIEEALEAEAGGADYIGLGPVFPTTSKEDAGQACGLALLREVKKKISIPVVAIGGITFDNAPEVVRAGADGLAVISAVLKREDIAAACRELRDLICKVRSQI